MIDPFSFLVGMVIGTVAEPLAQGGFEALHDAAERQKRRLTGEIVEPRGPNDPPPMCVYRPELHGK